MVTPSRVDPPESLMSLEDDPDYQESRSLLRSWESKTSEEHSSESYDTACSQQFVTIADSQHSLENRNDGISCDAPGLTTPGVIEPSAVARLMLELKTSPPRFDELATFPLFRQEKVIHLLTLMGTVLSSAHMTLLHKEQDQESIMTPQVPHYCWLKPRQPEPLLRLIMHQCLVPRRPYRVSHRLYPGPPDQH